MKIKGINSGEVSVTEAGGMHAELNCRFDLIDSKALFKLAAALHEGGVKYGDENWRKVPIRHQLNHALTHIFAYLAGDTQEEHLSHAFTRMMFATALEKEGENE